MGEKPEVRKNIHDPVRVSARSYSNAVQTFTVWLEPPTVQAGSGVKLNLSSAPPPIRAPPASAPPQVELPKAPVAISQIKAPVPISQASLNYDYESDW